MQPWQSCEQQPPGTVTLITSVESIADWYLERWEGWEHKWLKWLHANSNVKEMIDLSESTEKITRALQMP